MSALQDAANIAAQAINQFGNHSAQAAARANGVSAAAQNAQGAYNAGQAAIANGLGSDRIANQYGFNGAQAQIANDFTGGMWDKAAAWNEEMWERTAAWNEMMWQKQADFNAAEALKNRQWQQKMANTSYQRAVKDMEKAGINPILASGGVAASAGGSGSAAQVGMATMSNTSMSGAQGQAASGGLLQGVNATESSYSGQMEYMSGMLGLLSAGIGALGSAAAAFKQSGLSERLIEELFKTIDEHPNNYKAGRDSGMIRGFLGSMIKQFCRESLLIEQEEPRSDGRKEST